LVVKQIVALSVGLIIEQIVALSCGLVVEEVAGLRVRHVTAEHVIIAGIIIEHVIWLSVGTPEGGSGGVGSVLVVSKQIIVTA